MLAETAFHRGSSALVLSLLPDGFVRIRESSRRKERRHPPERTDLLSFGSWNNLTKQ